jgi:hypothetical protein
MSVENMPYQVKNPEGMTCRYDADNFPAVRRNTDMSSFRDSGSVAIFYRHIIPDGIFSGKRFVFCLIIRQLQKASLQGMKQSGNT